MTRHPLRAELIAKAMKWAEDPHAGELIISLVDAMQAWHDGDTDGACWSLVSEVMLNPFFAANSERLAPPLAMVAGAWESGAEPWQGIADLVCLVILLAAGREVMQLHSEELHALLAAYTTHRRTNTPQDLVDRIIREGIVIDDSPCIVRPQELQQAANALFLPNMNEAQIPYRERFAAFERALSVQPPAAVPTQHSFSDGLYRRGVTFPPGTLVTGKVHRSEHMIALMSGEILLSSESGPIHMKAPCHLVVEGGGRRAGLAITEVVWVNYHPNPDNITDISELEKRLVCSDFSAIEIEHKDQGDASWLG